MKKVAIMLCMFGMWMIAGEGLAGEKQIVHFADTNLERVVRQALLTNELTGTWIKVPQNGFKRKPKKPNPVIIWDAITFTISNTVTWVWVRNGEEETNDGSYVLQTETPIQQGMREKRDIIVAPRSLSVTSPLILSNLAVFLMVGFCVLQTRGERYPSIKRRSLQGNCRLSSFPTHRLRSRSMTLIWRR